MGSPYLNSNESIILSTNNVIVNTVPAEAILTNERLMLIDTRHAELRPQDIPFHAVETVTIGEHSDQNPMLSLSLVTGPGVTQSLGIIFPQTPKIKRLAERDEWANRLKELSIVTIRDGGKSAMEIMPPWIPGPLPEESPAGAPPAPAAEAESKFKNPPLMPRKVQKPPAPENRMVIAAAAVVIVLIVLVAGVYLFAPSLFGKGPAAVPPTTPVPATVATTVQTPVPTKVPETIATTVAATTAATPRPTAVPGIIVPETGVWVAVKYEGAYTGSAGAPGRFRTIEDTGDHIYQLPVRDEIISASVQKQDNTGRKLVVEFYSGGKLIKSGSVTAPKGTVNIYTDLRTA